MRRWGVIALAVALFLACLLAYAIFGGFSASENFRFGPVPVVGHNVLSYLPHLLMATVKTNRYHLSSSKNVAINSQTKKSTKISIFEGRGADKNLAIFNILVAVGPLSIGDIQRRLNRISGLEVTYYASLNKRIHALLEGGYIGKVKPAGSGQAGCKAALFEVRPKFYLAYYLNGKSREEILSKLNESNATIILSDLINAEIIET